MRKSDRKSILNNAPRSAAHAAVVEALRALRAATPRTDAYAAAAAALAEAVQAPSAWGPSGSLFTTSRSGAWWAGDRGRYITLHLNSRKVAEVEVVEEFSADVVRLVHLVPRDEAEAQFVAARAARREAAVVAAAAAVEVRRIIAAATPAQRGAMYAAACGGGEVALAGGAWFDGGFVRREDRDGAGVPAHAAVMATCAADHAAWAASVDAGIARVFVAAAEAAWQAKVAAEIAAAEAQVAALKRQYRAA